MTQRTALLIAAGLTAFTLVLLGGLAAVLIQPDAPAPAPAPAAAEAAAPASAAPAAGAADREAVYQAALQEAQARLEEANRRLAQAAAAPPTPVPPEPPTAVPAPAYAVAADQAVLIALGSAPGAALSAPAELVRYQDRVAYEVRLDRGLVYVDATSGQILYNGTAGPTLVTADAPAPPAQTAHEAEDNAPAAGARHEDDDEHEAGGDD